MKNVILSADCELKVYSVPDEVAGNLRGYCLEFIKWLNTNPNGQKYYIEKLGGFAFDESDFIEYLNTYKFSDERSVFVENLGRIHSKKDIPEHCKKYKKFNF